MKLAGLQQNIPISSTSSECFLDAIAERENAESVEKAQDSPDYTVYTLV